MFDIMGEIDGVDFFIKETYNRACSLCVASKEIYFRRCWGIKTQLVLVYQYGNKLVTNPFQIFNINKYT